MPNIPYDMENPWDTLMNTSINWVEVMTYRHDEKFDI